MATQGKIVSNLIELNAVLNERVQIPTMYEELRKRCKDKYGYLKEEDYIQPWLISSYCAFLVKQKLAVKALEGKYASVAVQRKLGDSDIDHYLNYMEAAKANPNKKRRASRSYTGKASPRFPKSDFERQLVERGIDVSVLTQAKADLIKAYDDIINELKAKQQMVKSL